MLKKWLQLLKKDERGLTLVELLAVIVILAIVGAIAFVAIGNVIENSRQDAHISNAIQAISAAELGEAGGTLNDDDLPINATVLENFDNTIVNPLDNEDDDYDFEIDKNDNGEFTATSSDAGCDFTATKAQLNTEGRGLCDND
jgi:type IV pilus assembly protein PilA